MGFEIRKKNGKQAIFKGGKQITDWFDDIWTYDGLLKGQSNFFKARKDGKWAIYEYKNGQVIKVTDDFDDIGEYGLAKGESNYFVARENGKESIYQYKDGIVQKITDDFDDIMEYGLVEGKSNFILIELNGNPSVYHKFLNKKNSKKFYLYF